MRSYITFSTIRIYDVNSSPLQFWFMDYKPCNKQQWYNGVSSTVNINSMTWEFKLSYKSFYRIISISLNYNAIWFWN